MNSIREILFINLFLFNRSFARLEDGNLKLSLTTLKQNDISPAMENFLIQLASSESIQVTGD